MYKKNIGTYCCLAVLKATYRSLSQDPVVRAMADRALLGRKYGDKFNMRKDFSRRSNRMINQFGGMSIGSF